MLAAPGRTWVSIVATLDVISVLAAVLLHQLLVLPITAALTFFLVVFLFFFRDPDREIGRGIVAPADGKIMVIEHEGERIRVGTFMNVTNVHVNRVPISGYLVRVDTREGPRAPAFSPKAIGNAQKRYLCGTPLGLVEIVQITGIVARRCVSYVGNGTPLRRGQRFGIVLFGSRVDVVLPKKGIKLHVSVGDVVHAGTTSLAEAA